MCDTTAVSALDRGTMTNRWMFAIAVMLASAITGAQPSSSKPRVLYEMRIIVAVDGVETSTATMVGMPGVPYQVFALLGPDADKSPRMRIEAAVKETQQAAAGPAVMIKLTLSKPDSRGDMQVFATPVVVASEGAISHVQVDNISLSIWVTRNARPAAEHAP